MGFFKGKELSLLSLQVYMLLSQPIRQFRLVHLFENIAYAVLVPLFLSLLFHRVLLFSVLPLSIFGFKFRTVLNFEKPSLGFSEVRIDIILSV